MLKGAQKRMIVVRTTDSKLFEEAYFVMRRDASHGGGHPDMLEEANRILESSLRSGKRERRRGHWRELLWGIGGFAAGVLLGGGGVGLLWLLL